MVQVSLCAVYICLLLTYAVFASIGIVQLPGRGGDAAFCWSEGGRPACL